MSKLVIVESPTKTKSLSNYLGKEYILKASYGHIRDLPKKELGVDVEHNFEPAYEIMKGKKKVVGELKTAAKDASEIYLATDPDREGEAIAYHIFDLVGSKSKIKPSSRAQVEGNQKSKILRVIFHEITQEAILEAFKHPRSLDFDLIDAWKARRILDRLVGYKLSPLLWKKVRYGLSAGRVQSVAVRLIVEREREREKFKIEPYFVIEGKFGLLNQPSREDFTGILVRIGKNLVFQKHTLQLFTGDYSYQDTIFKTQSQVDKILKDLQKQAFLVEKIEKKEVKTYPAPPFTTATLTRAASSQLGFSAKRTMRAAQTLYEQGFITYHRTDSTNLAKSALEKMRKFIVQEFGEKFLNPQEKVFKTKSKVAQEAHEAVRPTSWAEIKNQKSKIKKDLGIDEEKLYELIWIKTLATQFQPAVFDATRVLIKSEDGKYLFEAKGSVLKFEGYLAVYTKEDRGQKAEGGYSKAEDRKQTEDQALPELLKSQVLSLVKAYFVEKSTTPPPRYNEGSLIRDLEKFGIGRPSTYAPIISTIEERGYVEKQDGRTFNPTETGMIVNDLLTEHFPKIVDLQFTAQMEDDLDEIAKGEKEWVPVLREFYAPFEENLKEKEKSLKKEDITKIEELNEKCPECGKILEVKLGRFGKFVSCTGFPDCKYARPFEDKNHHGKVNEIDQEQLQGKCSQDEGELVLKEGRFGKFIACANYPKCKFTKPYLEKIGLQCPKCGKGEVVIKRTKRGKIFWGCSRYPECDWASWEDPRKKS